jgi:hypothetical protein
MGPGNLFLARTQLHLSPRKMILVVVWTNQKLMMGLVDIDLEHEPDSGSATGV